MTDKATPTLRQRCDTALQSLPDAPYKTMLAVLFDDMTAEIERLAAQSAPTVLSEDLTLAAVNCQHQIDADCIRLWRDEKKEGSALSQLVDRVVAVIEQSTAQPQAVVPADQRPVNCGTGYCSCIECVVEPTAQAERAPVVQASPEPFEVKRGMKVLTPDGRTVEVWSISDDSGVRCSDYQWHCASELRPASNADRASSGATPADVRMLTDGEELDCATKNQATRVLLHEGADQQALKLFSENVQRAAFRVNAGKRIPADGEVRHG